jgi:PAS domain S-box-containing protein
MKTIKRIQLDHGKNTFSFLPQLGIITIIAALIISILELADWISKTFILVYLFPGFKPMGPGTCLVIIFCSIITVTYYKVKISGLLKWFLNFTLGIIIIYSICIITEFMFGKPGYVERIFFSGLILSENPSFINTSFISAVDFMFISIVLFFIKKKNTSDKMTHISIILILFVVISALVLFLSYIYGTPLLYKKFTTLVAFPTSLAVFLLGAGILLNFETNYYPMRLFSGLSVRAKLLRRFLPFTFIIIILLGWLLNQFFISFVNYALIVSSLSIISIILIGIIIFRIADKIDNELIMLEHQRLLAEMNLKESFNRNQALVDANPDLLFLIYNNFKIIEYHKTASSFLKLEGNIIGKKIDEIFPNDVSPIFFQGIENIQRTREMQIMVFDYILNNIKLTLETRISLCGNDKILVIIRDVTEQKYAEEVTKYNESRLDILYRLSQSTNKSLNDIFHSALEEAIKFSSSSLGYICKYNSDNQELNSFIWSKEFLNNTEKVQLQSTYKVNEYPALKNVIISQKSILENKTAKENSFGQEILFGLAEIKRYMLIPIVHNFKTESLVCVADNTNDYSALDKNQLSYLMGEIWEILDRKKAEESLIQSEFRYRELFNKAPVGYHQIDKNRIIVQVNNTELEMLGYTENEMLNHCVCEFVKDKTIYKESILNKFECGDMMINSNEMTFIRKDGVCIPVLIDDILLKDSKGEIIGLRSTLQDISERKRYEIALHESNMNLEATLTELRETQKQVLQQERLRALGQMASGIAHDINNSLTPIIGYLEILMEDENISALAGNELNKINIASNDIKRTIQRMKEFYRAKDDNEDLHLLNLNSIILETIDLTKHKWKDLSESHGAEIKIIYDLSEDIHPVTGNASEIREALTNLIINATDAMPLGGVISIKTGSYSNQVFMEISDSGTGMDEETLKRCMEPFYSTKGDKGTGLGLSMVYGIVQRHEGKIEIESFPGKGTEFKIFLPKRSLKNIPKPEIPAPSIATKLKILIVDDNIEIRELLNKILGKDGHIIQMKSSGHDGLEIFNLEMAKNNSFDIVITDLGMAQMDGKTFSRLIKDMSPKTPIILLTGWGSFLDKENYEEVDYILSKPIEKKDLREAIETCLNLNN